MNILVFGAGVLGSLYAAKLQEAGQVVTILARGSRLDDIRAHGLILINGWTQEQTVTKVAVIDHLSEDDPYDLAIVLVRKNQLADVLPTLAKNTCIPNILVMVNNAEGPDNIVRQLGKERVLLGFPGAGGQRDGYCIHYQLVPSLLQPTTLGELDGRKSPRVREIARIFHAAGFPVTISTHMTAWLQTHAMLVSPIANAIYRAGGNCHELAHSPGVLVQMVRAIREQFQVLQALGVPIMPAKYRMITWLPVSVLVALCKIGFGTPQAELLLSRHANAARDEMAQITLELKRLAEQAQKETPISDELTRSSG